MEPTGSAKPTNPLLAHLNDQDEAHASTKVDFLHPGTVVMPSAAKTPEPAPEPTPPAPEVPVPPAETPPPPPTPTPAPPKSPHNSKPLIIAVIILVLLLIAGGGAYYWFKIRKPASTSTSPTTPKTQTTVTAVAPTNLAQKTSGGQPIASGGAAKPPLELDFTMATTANSGSVEPQVEVEPLATAFTGQPNYKGSAITAAGSNIGAKVNVTDLTDGSYHWQARFMVGSQASDWVAFGSGNSADFVIKTTAPKAPAVSSVGSKSVKGTSLTTTENPTTISGTAEAGDAISVQVSPDNQTATATADSSGAWSVTLQQGLANGDHTVTVTSTDSAGNTAGATLALSVNTATAAPATQTVAPTGDNTAILTLVGLAAAGLAAGGLILVRRRGQPQI